MKFPAEAINNLTKAITDSVESGEEPFPLPAFCDNKTLSDIVEYAEYAHAKLIELEQQRSELMFKLRCVAQALK